MSYVLAMKLGPFHKKRLASKRRRTHVPEPSPSNTIPLLPTIPPQDIRQQTDEEEYRDLYSLADMVDVDIRQEPFNRLPLWHQLQLQQVKPEHMTKEQRLSLVAFIQARRAGKDLVWFPSP